MTSRNCQTGVEVQSIRYTIQRDGGSVHTVQVDPVDAAMTCTCAAGIYGRTCWAQRLVMAGQAGKPRVRATVHAPLPKATRARTSAQTADLTASLDV